jgi:membrane-associated protease RseP (regulator of RpoE activity)
MSKTARTVGLVASLLIHLLLAVLIFWHPTPPIPPPPPPPTQKEELVQVRLLPPPSTEPVVETEQQKNDRMQAAARKEVCKGKDKHYTGIGIIWQPGSGFIIEAPEGFPAYGAGIRPGDILQNPYHEPDANGVVTIRIERYDKQLVFKVKQGKICYEDKPDPKVDISDWDPPK